MKTFLLITGIVIIAACVLSVLFAVLNLAAYHNMLDGSPEHYAKMRRRATVYFIVGAVFAVFGVVCLLIRVII